MSRHETDNTTGKADMPHPVTLARQTLNLSREGLAFKAHVSVKTIERMERGETTPYWNTREAIARVLKCKSQDLFPLEEAA